LLSQIVSINEEIWKTELYIKYQNNYRFAVDASLSDPIFEKKYLYNNSYTNILNNLYLFGIGFKAYITYNRDNWSYI